MLPFLNSSGSERDTAQQAEKSAGQRGVSEATRHSTTQSQAGIIAEACLGLDEPQGSVAWETVFRASSGDLQSRILCLWSSSWEATRICRINAKQRRNVCSLMWWRAGTLWGLSLPPQRVGLSSTKWEQVSWE